MKLKPRLAAVAEMVPSGMVVADIGTDHGHLPFYLVKNNISPCAIATDKSSACLEKTKSLLRLFNYCFQVELRLGDGLQALKKEDCPEVIVIAGMGARSIIQILGKETRVLSRVKCLVLQPMGEEQLLRRWLIANNWYLEHEKLAYERKTYYQVIRSIPGKHAYVDPFWLEIGPRLIDKRDPLLAPYLEQQIFYYQSLLNKLDNKTSPKASKRFRYLKIKIEKIEEVLVVAGQDKKCARTYRSTGASLPVTKW